MKGRLNGRRRLVRLLTPRTREGSALLIALLAMAGLSILGVSLMVVTDTELQVSNDERLRKQALYAAEAGIEHALVYIKNMKPECIGIGTCGNGLLSGSLVYAGANPPDNTQAWNEPITPLNENLYLQGGNAGMPWRRPALARKGNILWFQASGAAPPWYNSGGPANAIAIRDIPFEQSAGAGMAYDVGTFKSKYSVYVKNNLDDPKINISQPNGYLYDEDQTVTLTGEGVVEVGNLVAGSTTATGYRVIRRVELTVAWKKTKEYDDHCSAAGCGGANNSLWNDGQTGEVAGTPTIKGGTEGRTY